jgi:hypothetical protein
MKGLESEQLSQGLRRKGHKLAGILLAAIGLSWLAHKAGWMPVSADGSVIFWPLFTIGVGLSILLGSRHRQAEDSK